MDFSLRSEEEALRLAVQEFVRKELVSPEQMFEHAPDIFVGSRWKTHARLSQDLEIQRWRGY